MNNLNTEMLMQCPCSDGGANPLLLLAVFAGAWLLFNWIRKLIKSKGVSIMNKAMKIIIVIALIAVVAIVIAVKQHHKNSTLEPVAVSNQQEDVKTENIVADTVNPPKTENLPKILDLGAGKCIPCKMMFPVLDELGKDYSGKLKVEFIDVWENPAEAKKYKINLIPTQIFYDANGKELFRHEGFFSKEDILAKWKELGIDLEK